MHGFCVAALAFACLIGAVICVPRGSLQFPNAHIFTGSGKNRDGVHKHILTAHAYDREFCLQDSDLDGMSNGMELGGTFSQSVVLAGRIVTGMAKLSAFSSLNDDPSLSAFFFSFFFKKTISAHVHRRLDWMAAAFTGDRSGMQIYRKMHLQPQADILFRLLDRAIYVGMHVCCWKTCTDPCCIWSAEGAAEAETSPSFRTGHISNPTLAGTLFDEHVCIPRQCAHDEAVLKQNPRARVCDEQKVVVRGGRQASDVEAWSEDRIAAETTIGDR